MYLEATKSNNTKKLSKDLDSISTFKSIVHKGERNRRGLCYMIQKYTIAVLIILYIFPKTKTKLN